MFTIERNNNPVALTLEGTIVGDIIENFQSFGQFNGLDNEIMKDPSILEDRITELGDVNFKILEQLDSSDELSPQLKDLQTEVNYIKKRTSFPLRQEHLNRSEHTAYIKQMLLYVRSHESEYTPWTKITKNTNKLLSKILLRGFSLYLGFACDSPKLPNLYESAVFDLLKQDFPESKLAKDLLTDTSSP